MTYQSFPCHIEEIHLESNKKILSKIVSCWRQSVEATRGFLTQTDIEHIARYVPDAIKSVTHLALNYPSTRQWLRANMMHFLDNTHPLLTMSLDELWRR